MPTGLGERVKIVATVGPASARPEVLRRVVEAGADALRLNASHVAPEEVGAWVRRARAAARAAGRTVAVILDLQGVKRRIGDLPEPLTLQEGQRVVLSPRGGEGRIPVASPTIRRHLAPGTDVFLKDGFLRLRVLSRRGSEVRCEVVRGGVLTSRAGLNLPGVPVAARVPTRRDLEHVAAGREAGVDFLALSFVRSARDVERCARHADGIPVLAKIERPEAVAAIDEVAAAADGVLVARGDLAVEMRPEELPVLQKRLLARANRARKPAIVATEMLASMVHSSRPTRAELTDVGNAVLDGADATLLSGETAVGHDPARAVLYMARILAAVERSLLAHDVAPALPRDGGAARVDWAIADAAAEAAADVGAKAILAITGSGRTARLLSASRPSVPIFAFARDAAVRRRVALLWGVYAHPAPAIRHPDRLIARLLAELRGQGRLARGDRAVAVFGAPLWAEGTKTNTIRVARA